MKGSWWAGRRAADGGRKLRLLASGLLNQSFVIYLVVVVAGKTWLLLNSDVMQLVRRVH